MHILFCCNTSILEAMDEDGISYIPEINKHDKYIILYNGLRTPVHGDYVINQNKELLQVLESQECSTSIAEVYQRYPYLDLGIALIDKNDIGIHIPPNIDVPEYYLYEASDIVEYFEEKLGLS